MAAVTLRYHIWTKHRNLSGNIFSTAFPSGQQLSIPAQARACRLGAVQIFLWSWPIMILTIQFGQPGWSFLESVTWSVACQRHLTHYGEREPFLWGPPAGGCDPRGQRSAEAGWAPANLPHTPRRRRLQSRRRRAQPRPAAPSATSPSPAARPRLASSPPAPHQRPPGRPSPLPSALSLR